MEYKLEDINENNADCFCVCRICKNIKHFKDQPIKRNYVCLKKDGNSDVTIVVECKECHKIQQYNELLEKRKNRLELIKQYLSEDVIYI